MDNNYFAKLFSKNLVRIMEMRQKTQTDIINALGFNKSAVSTWVNGTRMPRMDKVDALAKYFNVSRSDLISEPLHDIDNLSFNNIGAIIKQYRIRHNLTMAEFAEKSNLSKGYISMLENNRNPQNNRALVPSVETFNKVASAMGISIETLISMTNSTQPIELNSTPKVDKNIEFIPNMTTTKIKVYGSVPAGVPVTAIEDIQGTVDIPSHWLSSGYDYMGIVVKGDSMFPKYQEGDIVVIRVQPDCENGQDCVVYINGDEATLKKVIKNSDCIILQPMNSEYTPIVVDYMSEDFKILGVVVQLVRYV